MDAKQLFPALLEPLEPRFLISASPTFLAAQLNTSLFGVGGSTGEFTLSVTSDPKDDCGGTNATARSIYLNRSGNAAFRGTTNYAGDRDVLTFIARKDGLLRVGMSATGRGNLLDSRIFAYDASGNLLASNDNSEPGTSNAVATFSVQAGARYYVWADGAGGTTGTYRIDLITNPNPVPPPNNPPSVVGETAQTSEDTPITIPNVLANDSDPDGDTLSIGGFTQPTHGSVSYNGSGTFGYTPQANYNGADGFTYTVSDGRGGSTTAMLSITVNSINDAPVAANDVVATNEDILVITGNVLANDSDADGDALTVSGFTQPARGSVSYDGGGTFRYTPQANYNGADSFTYTVSDGQGGIATATVSITVNPVNDAPVANDDGATTLEDTPVVTGNVLANDSDADGDALTVSGFTQPSN
jgi:VCBS repeat-containing protein